MKEVLDKEYIRYNTDSFIIEDPISIPHSFSKIQDIEISGFFAAIFAWGKRKIIINKSKELMSMMDNSPYDFIMNSSDRDIEALSSFKHRTFNFVDLKYFIRFFKHHYLNHSSLEDAFLMGSEGECFDIERSLVNFHDYFFSLSDSPQRTVKHIATPARNSTCKRINMFLRWMVRKDDKGVDFGIWHRVPASKLLIPCDVHVLNVSRRLGLLIRDKNDWKSVLELTSRLASYCSDDPVKYDFALFSLGVEGRIDSLLEEIDY